MDKLYGFFDSFGLGFRTHKPRPSDISTSATICFHNKLESHKIKDALDYFCDEVNGLYIKDIDRYVGETNDKDINRARKILFFSVVLHYSSPNYFVSNPKVTSAAINMSIDRNFLEDERLPVLPNDAMNKALEHLSPGWILKSKFLSSEMYQDEMEQIITDKIGAVFDFETLKKQLEKELPAILADVYERYLKRDTPNTLSFS